MGETSQSAVDCSILVVAFHSRDDLRTLLASVPAACAGIDWHLTLVNNAVDDPLDEFVGIDPRVSVVEAGDNLGYSGALNVGLRAAPAAEWTLFLNPDLTLTAGAAAELRRALHAGAGAAVPLVLGPTGEREDSVRREPSLHAAVGEALFGDHWPSRPVWLSETVRDPAAYAVPHAIDWATGAALAVRAEVIAAVGAWDAARFFMYSEETDYARRIRALGHRISFTPTAVVRHRGGGSGSSARLDALLEVNKVVYYRKWHRFPPSLLFACVQLVRNLVRPHRAGSRLAVRAMFSRQVRRSLPGGRG